MTTRSLIALALRQRCKPEHNYVLSRVDRWRLTAKALICLLFGRDGAAAFQTEFDHVDVAMLDGGTYTGDYGTHYWWEALCVSHGWRHWRVEVFSDGSP